MYSLSYSHRPVLIRSFLMTGTCELAMFYCLVLHVSRGTQLFLAAAFSPTRRECPELIAQRQMPASHRLDTLLPLVDVKILQEAGD